MHTGLCSLSFCLLSDNSYHSDHPCACDSSSPSLQARRVSRWCNDLCAGVSAVNRTITARAVEARLSLSKTMLDFGSQIVLRSNQVKPPYSLDVLLTSNEEGDIAWQMGLPSCEGLEGCGGVFAMEPNSGTLAKVGLSDLLRNGSTHAWLIIVCHYHNNGQPH